MQKVYLLRNDRKTGPFTLPELMQQSLQPADLLWIEGQSTAWTTLSDLELNPSLPADTTPAPETAASLEDKADAIRRRALETPPRVFTRTPDTRYNYHEEDPGEDAIVLIDHRKQRNNMVGEVLMTLFIVALIGGGLLGSRRLFRAQSTTAAPAVTRMSTSDEHTAVRAQPVTPVITAPPTTDTQLVTTPAPIASAILPARRTITPDSSARITAPKTKAIEDTQKIVKEETPKSAPAAHTEEKKEAKDEKTATAPPPAEETAEPQKHKGLGQALKNLFRKKKKDNSDKTDN